MDLKAISTVKRGLERRLLIFSLTLVLAGLSLVYFGKVATTPPLPSNAVNINTADADTLGSALAVPVTVADVLVQYRTSLPGSQFPSTYRLKRCIPLKNTAVDWQPDRMYAREPSDVARTFLIVAICFIIVFVGFHLVLTLSRSVADPFLMPIGAVLAGVGLMFVYSVRDPYRDTFAYSSQSFGVIVYGVAACAVPLTRLYRKLPLHRYTYAYALAALVLLAVLMLLGRGPAETHISLFGFEPIEFIKVFLVFFIAAYLAERRMAQGSRVGKGIRLPNFRDILPLLGIYLFALSLFGAVKDLGPAVLLFGTFVAMLYLVTGRVSFPILGMVLLLLAAYAGDRLGAGFFATRVDMWLHPWDNSNRLGGQLGAGLWGLGTGGMWGSGLGLGEPAFVPRAGSDMIFTSLGEELGLFGGLFVLSLYSFIIYRGFCISRAALDDFDRLVASGVTTLLGLQAFVITGGATGLIPLTGITLPFISYGSSSLIASFFCLGVLLSISSKTAPTSIKIETPPLYKQTSRNLATALVCLLLMFVGVGRLVWLQGLDDQDIATRALRIPDADKVSRWRRNPRLLAYASTVQRGIITDRNGKVLAGNAGPGHGISFLAGIPRVYPYGEVGADIVNAAEQPMVPDNPLGCDQLLRGYSDMNQLLDWYRAKDLPNPPQPKGQNVSLTVDIGLQKTAQESLEKYAKLYGEGRGAVVVVDVRTGALLAAATAPTFNPGLLTSQVWDQMHSGSTQYGTLQNRAFAAVYPPGSIFKLVTATAAYESNDSDLVFQCNHILPVVHWRFNGERYARRDIVDDEEFQPHGTVDMDKAIRVSCNVYFAQLGIAIGAPALEQTIQQYQLVNCPPLGRIGADLPDSAYGQGPILVTPYQMARVCQVIANHGVPAGPQFVASSTPATTEEPILPQVNADQLAGMMRDVVTSGTAVGVFPGLSVAGKTGSAQVAAGKSHSWFVGFAPAESPSIAFACIIEHGGHGRTAAAPVCRDIITKALH